MAYTGTRSAAESIQGRLNFFSLAAVTAGQVLAETTVASGGHIGGVAANAVTAGAGAGSTTLDVLINGVSAYTVTANRPTLAAASTGNFTNFNTSLRAFRPGDRITVIALSIPATTGHARVSGELCLEN